MWRLSALLFAVPLMVAAQNGEYASISGQVVNAATGEPVRKAIVFLRGKGDFSTTADAAGRFAMTNLDPGSYSLSAEHAGYIPTAYGARIPGHPGAPFMLTRGQRMTEIVLRLTPQGVISGRVLDEDGDAVRGVVVQIARFTYTSGRRRLMPTGSTNTNDLGEYRVPDLPPGKYFVSAIYNQSRFQSTEDRSAVARADGDYVPTFYPNARDAAAAVQLTLAPGTQIRNIDIVLAKLHTVSVRGRVVNNSPARTQTFAATLLSSNSMGMTHGSPLTADGDFEIKHVPPGSYMLVVHANDAMKAYSARRPVEVGNGDVGDVLINVGPGVTVAGRVRLEGDAGELPQNARVNFPLYEPASAMFGPLPNGRLNPDGTFRFEGVNPERYAVNLSGLLDGFYTKSMRSGNVDVLAGGLEIGSAAPEPIDIVVSANAPQITGVVQDSNQQPAPGVPVVLIPQEKERRNRTSFYRTIYSDASGRFSLRGIMPGDYKVYAWDDVEQGVWFDPDFLALVEAKGAAVTLKDGSRETVTVTLITANNP